MAKLRIIPLFLLVASGLEAVRPYRWIERPFGDSKLSIRGLAEAPDGSLTIASEELLYRFDGKTVQKMSLSIGTGPIHSLAYDRFGNLVVGRESGFWIWTEGRLLHLPAPTVSRIMPIGDRIGARVVSAKGVQFALLTRNPWQFRLYDPVLRDSVIIEVKDGEWTTSCGTELCALEPDGTQLRFHVRRGLATSRSKFFEALKVSGNSLSSYSDLIERSSAQKCALEVNTLVCLDGGKIIRFDLPQSISGTVRSFLVDRHGVLWLGMDRYGLLGLANLPGVEQFGAAEGLTALPFHFCRLNAETLIAATTLGLFVYDPPRDRWNRWGTQTNPGKYAACLATDQGLLVAETDRDVQMRGLGGEILKRWFPERKQERKFRAMVQDSSQNAYIAGEALWRLALGNKDANLNAIRLPRDGLIKDVASLRDGRLAISYMRGFALGREGAWVQVDERNGLKEAQLESVALGGDPNEFWVTYDNGIGFAKITVDPSGKASVVNFGRQEGFSDNRTYDIYLSQRGQLWRGTQFAISVASPSSLEVKDWKVWDAAGGLSNPDVSANSIFEDVDGSIWVGTMGGALRLSGAALVQDSKKPLEVFATVTSTQPAVVNLAHRNLLSPNMVHFEYRRAGAENWTTANRDLLEFGDLRAGIHRYEVRVAASRFFTPANTASVVIEVPPQPWPGWLQWLLPAAMTLAVVGLWRLRFYVFAWLPIPRLRRFADRHWFTALKHAAQEDRAIALRRLPPRFRQRLEGMFLMFNDLESGEDDRTRSGIVLQSRYLLEHVIAKGGFATVYIAQDLQASSTVAVKLFHRSNAPGAWLDRRLSAEIEAMKRIDHPHVLRLLDSGTTSDSRPFLVVEYIRGINLRQALRTGPLPLPRAIDRVMECCDALEHVHSLGILHRDLKPENVLLENAGSAEEKAILIDFGVATIYDSLHDGAQSTFFAASLDYVAPEQIGGMKVESSDVYSLGLILFELLTGLRFKATFGGNVTLDRLRQELASRGIPAELAYCLYQATALEHSRRFATVAQFRRCLVERSVHNR